MIICPIKNVIVGQLVYPRALRWDRTGLF